MGITLFQPQPDPARSPNLPPAYSRSADRPQSRERQAIEPFSYGSQSRSDAHSIQSRPASSVTCAPPSAPTPPGCKLHAPERTATAQLDHMIRQQPNCYSRSRFHQEMGRTRLGTDRNDRPASGVLNGHSGNRERGLTSEVIVQLNARIGCFFGQPLEFRGFRTVILDVSEFIPKGIRITEAQGCATVLPWVVGAPNQ